MARPRLERSDSAFLQLPGDKAKHETAADIFGRSRWIWPNRHHWDIANSYALFRKSFQLGALPSQAPLFITADQSYRLFVNGQFVARGPARGVQSHWPYDEIDIRKYLKKGRNVLAIRAYNPGRSTYQYLSAGFAGLLVAASWGKITLSAMRLGSPSARQAPVGTRFRRACSSSTRNMWICAWRKGIGQPLISMTVRGRSRLRIGFGTVGLGFPWSHERFRC